MQSITTTTHGGITADTRDAYTRFLDDLDTSQKTRESYERALRQWRHYLDGEGVTTFDATRETVVSYKRSLEEKHAPATVNAYLTAVRRFYSWLESMRIYPNVAAGVKGEKMNRRSPKDALTVSQAERVLSRRRETLQDKRDYAIVNLLMRRGLRTVEAVRANIGDIRQVNGEAVLYLQGKGYADKGEFVVLGESCLMPIYEYLEARGVKDADAPLFAAIGNRNSGGRMTTRSISRVCKEVMSDAGISSANLTAHSLRHTAVTFALLGGATVQETQVMARHADISTTMIYAHNLDRMNGGAERSVDAFMGGFCRA